MASISILDTNTHNYKTNPNNIFIYHLGTSQPPIKSFAIWVFNGENQTLTATPIANIVNDGSYNDVPIATPSNTTGQYSIPSSSSIYNIYNFADYSIEYVSIALSFSTAPTSGNIISYLFIYYE